MARGGSGGLVGLESSAEIVGGEFALDLGQLVFEADAFRGDGADALERDPQLLCLAGPLGRKFGTGGLL